MTNSLIKNIDLAFQKIKFSLKICKSVTLPDTFVKNFVKYLSILKMNKTI